MNFLISASTDAGNIKTTNQDSVNVQLLEQGGRQLVFAVLCDGMGGLQKGELASASVIQAFRGWCSQRLEVLLQSGLQDSDIRREWTQVITDCNEKIKAYGREKGVRLGTTATVLLLTEGRYYVANVGDSRAYELFTHVTQITRDQTVVAREIELGLLAPEQAETDPRRSVLLQCIGASQEVYADFFFGTPQENAVYLLCSDGFRHKITSGEMLAYLEPCRMNSPENMRQNEQALIRLIKERNERDNITVATIRTYM
ncbi:MAG: protein phosphatase 2C domain-containing protein [Acetatifactor sp.]|nr:protein phosphatase 2C domain-containing protein [Acetatifactor sp.]